MREGSLYDRLQGKEGRREGTEGGLTKLGMAITRGARSLSLSELNRPCKLHIRRRRRRRLRATRDRLLACQRRGYSCIYG